LLKDVRDKTNIKAKNKLAVLRSIEKDGEFSNLSLMKANNLSSFIKNILNK
jgi:hypothetical protein